MKTLKERSFADIYLEYVNDFLTTEYMAEYYGISQKEMEDLISKGRELHESQFN